MGQGASVPQLQDDREAHGYHGQDGKALRTVTGQEGIFAAAVPAKGNESLRLDRPVRCAFRARVPGR